MNYGGKARSCSIRNGSKAIIESHQMLPANHVRFHQQTWIAMGSLWNLLVASNENNYWLVVSNIWIIFHNIWDNPSHWLIFFKMVGIPPTSLWLNRFCQAVFGTFFAGRSEIPPRLLGATWIMPLSDCSNGSLYHLHFKVGPPISWLIKPIN